MEFVSDVQIFRESYLWSIKKFTKALKNKKVETFKSPIFGSKLTKGKGPCFDYVIELAADSQDISLSISAQCLVWPIDFNNVTCRFSVINSFGNFVNTKFNDFQFSKEESCKSFKFLKKNDIMENLDDLVSGDILRLYCEIVNKETCIINTPMHQIPEDFEPFFQSELLSDTTIVTKNTMFPVHKVMLSARSSVFSEMFSSSPTKPSVNNKIEINDLNDNAIREVLRFIYTGKVSNIHKMAENLLIAADRYKIDELKCISENSLCKTITIQNAAKRLLLANNHNATNLKKAAVLFIYQHRKQITNTQDYKLIERSHPSILAEAFRILLLKND